MRDKFLWGTLYGLASMFVSGSGIIIVVKTWPDPWTWVQLGFILAGQFGLGVFTYMQSPEKAWFFTPGRSMSPGGTLTEGTATEVKPIAKP